MAIRNEDIMAEDISIVKMEDGSSLVSDKLGRSFTWPAPSKDALIHFIDPRINLTAPIYEQVQELAAKDKSAETRKAKRKLRSTAA